MNWPFRTKSTAPSGLFETVVLPHLDSAHRLARWLARDPALAEDVVQEAALRAFKHIASYDGGDGRAWFLKVVRNAAYDALAARKRGDGCLGGDDGLDALEDPADGPEEILSRSQDRDVLAKALAALPLDLRECLVLRELEGLSYKEIAQTVGVPTGTVMSRLWRARRTLMENAAKGREI